MPIFQKSIIFRWLFILTIIYLCLYPTHGKSLADEAERRLSRLEQTCASQKTCDACYRTTGCHFCVDSQRCHAMGSFYGCLWGASCDPAQCYREASEHIGATGLPAITVIYTLGIAAFLCVALIMCLHVCMYGFTICRVCFGRGLQPISAGSQAVPLIPDRDTIAHLETRGVQTETVPQSSSSSSSATFPTGHPERDATSRTGFRSPPGNQGQNNNNRGDGNSRNGHDGTSHPPQSQRVVYDGTARWVPKPGHDHEESKSRTFPK